MPNRSTHVAGGFATFFREESAMVSDSDTGLG
jgi:hypothetical protein